MIQEKTYSYWMPGGITGTIKALSAIKAAEKVLLDTPLFVSGNWQIGLAYIGATKGKEAKIYELKD